MLPIELIRDHINECERRCLAYEYKNTKECKKRCKLLYYLRDKKIKETIPSQ